MRETIRIAKLRDETAWTEQAVCWFHEKWKIPEEAYRESILECQQKKSAIPQWYLVLEQDKILGGLGVIANDFHKRKDLTPNVCAVYVEPESRGQGIARWMLEAVCADMAEMGEKTLYLITDHTCFYEKCGWHFFGMVEEDSGETARMYCHEMCPQNEQNGAMKELKNFLDKEGRLTVFPAKRKRKLWALLYLAGKFEPGKRYTEKEVNALLNQWHTFGDPATLRRELYDAHFLDRDGYGTAYWLEEMQPTLEK